MKTSSLKGFGGYAEKEKVGSLEMSRLCAAPLMSLFGVTTGPFLGNLARVEATSSANTARILHEILRSACEKTALIQSGPALINQYK